MIEYTKVAEVIQERVNNGTYTLEYANKLNDVAYAAYVEEKSAYNRTLDSFSDRYVKLEKEIYALVPKLPDPKAKAAIAELKKKQNEIREKARSMGMDVGSLNAVVDKKERRATATQPKGDDANVNREIDKARNKIASAKQQFNKAVNESGDGEDEADVENTEAEVTPEENQVAEESVDETVSMLDAMLHVYEAADAGCLTEDEKNELLALIKE